MDYQKFSNKIIVYNTADFNPEHICECGQMFRYYKVADGYIVLSGSNATKIEKSGSYYVLKTNNPDYFVNYFDLDTSYAEVKAQLSKNAVLARKIPFGSGIRIAKGDPAEIIIEFIISANNNINRIKKICEKLCEVGEDIVTDFGVFKAFPSMKVLASQSDDWYNSLGAGYRAPYIKQTAKDLASIDINLLKKLNNQALYNFLINFKGVGPKVASCIMLFGFGRKNFFPVDTWVEKVYKNHFYAGEKNRLQIQQYFENLFGENSGLAQQYLFYAEREGANKN